MLFVKILALDVGTEESGYCLLDNYSFKPLSFGKVKNEELLQIVKYEDYDILVYEKFACYGMAVSQTVFQSVEWNGRYIQSALDRGKDIQAVFRKDEKMTLCGTMKAKDTNIRQALIDRFAKFDFKNGKGTKTNPDFFYGFSKDMWSAYAVGITYLDRRNK